MVISEFRGEHRFLSNFWLCEVHLDGDAYPSVEHAFQAAKTFDERERAAIRTANSPGQAKRLGRKSTLREDWDDVKLDFMLVLVRRKFKHVGLAQRLLATGDQKLVEGNYWGDIFWGVCRGEGQNYLGRILMKVREEITAERQTQQVQDICYHPLW